MRRTIAMRTGLATLLLLGTWAGAGALPASATDATPGTDTTRS
ncbi:S1 family peptidase, partial [Streptomyces sp. YC419]|nr:S1 family peptidase [Streptomyces ureilyticus]